MVIQPNLTWRLLGGRSRKFREDSDFDEEIDLAAAGSIVVGNQGNRCSGRENTKTYIPVIITLIIVNAGRLRPIRLM